MPNTRSKTWTTTTPANVADAQHWEDHAVPDGGTTGQVLTKASSTDQDADWADPASSGHVIEDEDDNEMTQRDTLQFLNADVTDDSVNGKTVVDCKGSKGDAATIAVGTVTTLPAGSNATVTNTGTTSAAVFDFGIPQGIPGTGSPVWGAITGTLGDQTDLATALSGKADTSDIPTITDTYSDQSQDGMSGIAVASAVSGKADKTELIQWVNATLPSGSTSYNVSNSVFKTTSRIVEVLGDNGGKYSSINIATNGVFTITFPSALTGSKSISVGISNATGQSGTVS